MKNTLIFILVLCCLSLRAQTKPALLQKIKSSKDTAKVSALFAYGFWQESYNLDSAAYYYTQAGNLSRKLKYTKGILKYYANYTYILNQKGDLKNGLKLNLEALEIAKKHHNQRDIADFLFNTGSSYNNIGEFEQALTYYLQAAKKFENLKDEQSLITVYDNIGGVYTNSNQFEKGLKYHNKAYVLARKSKDEQGMAKILINKGITENFLKDTVLAIQDLTRGLKLSISSKNTYLQSIALKTFADIYIQTGKYDQSLNSAREAYLLALEIGSKYAEVEALKVMTASFHAKNMPDSTIYYGNKALAFGEANNFKNELYKLEEYLAKAYEQQGDFKNSLYHFKRFKQLNDSLLLKDVQLKMQLVENDYKTAKAQNEIYSLQSSRKKQQSIILFLVLALVLILLISLLIYNNNKSRRKFIEQEIVNLKKEENLNAARLILETQEEERLRIAKDLHDGLGGLLSGIKLTLQNPGDEKQEEKALKQLDTAINEMRRISHSMMPEALSKFGLVDALTDMCKSLESNKQFQINYQFFGFDERLPDNIETNLYRMILELLNNAIKHSQASEIYLQLIKDEKHISLTLEDNGIGLNTQELHVNEGMGFKNIQSRLKLINGSMEIKSEANQGTTVNIELTV